MAALKMRSIWFWQGIISPHMAGLAVALSRRGCKVTYLARQALSDDRARQGWSTPPLGGVELKLVATREAVEAQVAVAPPDSIHLCGGLRSHGLIGVAQQALARRQFRQWLVMETVDDAGWLGTLKRLEYARLLRRWRSRLQGVLAIGHATPEWLRARGVPVKSVFPFAYFLPDDAREQNAAAQPQGPFRFLFVGQLIERKRVDLLIQSLQELVSKDFRLVIVGAGALEITLRAQAMRALPGRVDWLAALPMEAARAETARAHCLVLPSRHDGWGAVGSEALMAGTPVICSDACGAAGVVQASCQGGVFGCDDSAGLTALLDRALTNGTPTPAERLSLAAWAKCLAADAGADYLLEILDHIDGRGQRPVPPWKSEPPSAS